jgi:F-type H+-transporting ATPase subunit a
MAGHADHFHHVRDFPYFEIWGGGRIDLPVIPGTHFQITKFMVLQVVACVLTLLIFRGLASRVASGQPTKGRFWNFWEALALFIRDEVVRPTIGDEHHDHGHDDHGHDHGHGHATHHEKPLSGHHSDRFLPYIWSCFFFVLFCNLLGAIPMLGSPTGSICVTGVLAAATFFHNVYQGSQQFGFVGFWKNQCPSLGLSGPMAIMIGGMLWVIECLGLFIKHGVLAVRLFANIMGGHTVIGVILGFIAMDGVAGTNLQWVVIPGSIIGQIFIGMLELFVAFLQAYVFAYLSTIFLSACLHAH